MKHIKLFEEYAASINEGAIDVYPPGNPYKKEGSIQWTGVEKHTKKWMDEGFALSLILDIDYDKYIADTKYRSIPMGTWNDKALPKFTEEFPKYREVEFDMLGIEENKEKPNEPWIRVADKRGLEFLVPPFKILDIQKGSSVRDRIAPSDLYLIDKMRARITNYKNGEVEVKMQDGSSKKIPIAQWKSANYTHIDESKKTEE